jgi:hypothetical protein
MVKLTTYLIKKFFGYGAPAATGIAALSIAGLLLAGCQSAPVDRKLDGYIMSSAKGAEATSFHTNLVDLIEGCSRDNKIPQAL